MSDLYQSLSHSKWDCKYHVVFVPKHRRKVIFGQTRRQLGPIFHALARQKECQIVEGHLMLDHVHICIEIPPKHPVMSENSAMNSLKDLRSCCSQRYAGVTKLQIRAA